MYRKKLQYKCDKRHPKYANIKETMEDVNSWNIAGLIMTSKMMCLKIVKNSQLGKQNQQDGRKNQQEL